MADLDRDLSNRLSRLADAVPVGRGELDPVYRSAVAARQSVRLAWITPLVVIVLVTVVAGLLNVGPFAHERPGDGPVVATAAASNFHLTIRSERAQYAAGEPIDVSATLTYVGSGGPIEIGHDIGRDGAPIGFGVTEPIFGGYHLSGDVSRLVCHQTTLSPSKPLDQPFTKTGGGSDGDVAGFAEYMRDPVFWLDAGTWHPYAVVQFSIGSCGAEVQLRAEISIDVVAPAPVAERWMSSVTEGDFELTVAAAKATFSVDEPLDVIASLVYRGPEEHILIHHLTWGPLAFGMWAPDITLNPRGRWTCSDLEMTRGVPITEPLLDLGNGGTTFTVPHGLHEISATAQFSRGSCSAPPESMETSILVAVADGPDDLPLLTDESSQVSVCLLVRNSGRLASSDTGLGVVTFDGKLRDVVWPTGYSARRTADGAVLLDRGGHEIAHEGDALLFDAISSEGQPLWPCGDVTAIEGSAPPVAPTTAPTPSPAAPGGGAYPTAGPGLLGGIGQEATDGTFTLQMYTDQGTVWTGNAIDVHLQVGYAGPDVDVAFWSANPAVIVGVEQLGGPHAAQGSRDLTCAPTSIFPGTVQDYAFRKSGGYEADDPDGPWLKSYFGDPDLHLTPGWWRISAYFEGYVGGCGGDVHKLAVEMVIIVIP